MKYSKGLFSNLSHLVTEKSNPRSRGIDKMSVLEILKIINKEDALVSLAVKKELPSISRVVDLVVKSFTGGGRLIYAGAGTSGRLGILDASECPPTFGASSSLVRGIIAGGKKSVFKAQEGAEDNENLGVVDSKKLNISNKDIVCGIAASLRTPYVYGVLKEAKKRGAKTVLITTNSRKVLNKKIFSRLKNVVDVSICASVGPEVIMGSTRMKSGTAQKLILNMITTTSFVRIGKTFENMMIDLQLTNNKLVERAKKIIMLITGVNYKTAQKFLILSGGHVKTALVMIKSNCSKVEARGRLKKANGFVRRAIDLSK